MTTIVQDRYHEITELCRRFKVKNLMVFGSAASARFVPLTSDLDFLVEFEPLTPAEHANCYFRLLAGLQNLFNRKIDLVEKGAIRNPFFKKDIETTSEIIYVA